MSFSFEPCLRKLEKQEKRGKQRFRKGLWHNSAKTQKNPTLEENPEKQRKGGKIEKA